MCILDSVFTLKSTFVIICAFLKLEWRFCAVPDSTLSSFLLHYDLVSEPINLSTEGRDHELKASVTERQHVITRTFGTNMKKLQ